jgi:hypothetical protein
MFAGFTEFSFVLFSLSTRLSESHSYILVCNEFISFKYNNVLHVSTYKAVIRQYTLTNIFKLLNCPLYEFIYCNIITSTNVSDFPLV